MLGDVYSPARYTVYMKRLNKTESPIFVILCVLYYQSQLFRFLLYRKQ